MLNNKSSFALGLFLNTCAYDSSLRAFKPLGFFSGASFFGLCESRIALDLATAALFKSLRYEFFPTVSATAL